LTYSTRHDLRAYTNASPDFYIFSHTFMLLASLQSKRINIYKAFRCVYLSKIEVVFQYLIKGQVDKCYSEILID